MIAVRSRRRPLFGLLLAAVALVIDVGVARSMSTTYDEMGHIRYGARLLHFRPGRDDRLDDSKMPASAFNAIPSVLAGILEKRHAAPVLASLLRDIRSARIATVLATLLLGCFVYRWAFDLYGETPAIVSVLLVVFSPNLVAHGTLATTEMYFALGVVGSLYFFRRYILQPTLRLAALSALVLALAQLTKCFAVYLYIVVGCFLFLVLVIPKLRESRGTHLTRKDIAIYASLAVVLFLAVVNVGFLFDKSLTPLGEYRFQSASFARFSALPILRSVPVPLPYPYLQGLDMMKNNEQTGATFGNIYLLGQIGNSLDPSFRGFKSYYLVALFFKEPIALQILFVIGLVWVWKNRSFSNFFFGEALLLAAAALLLAWLSFFSRAQIGIRHILPFFAIDVVIAGAAFVGFNSMSRTRKVFLGLLVLWLGVSVCSYYPNMIPYMNEWVLNRKLAYKILADSNLDWGQNSRSVEEFLKKNPDVIENPKEPVAGRILVDINSLVGVYPPTPDRMLWLRSCYTPVSQVGYADLLFVVPATNHPSNINCK